MIYFYQKKGGSLIQPLLDRFKGTVVKRKRSTFKRGSPYIYDLSPFRISFFDQIFFCQFCNWLYPTLNIWCDLMYGELWLKHPISLALDIENLVFSRYTCNVCCIESECTLAYTPVLRQFQHIWEINTLSSLASTIRQRFKIKTSILFKNYIKHVTLHLSNFLLLIEYQNFD